jgi:hypothetical protein
MAAFEASVTAPESVAPATCARSGVEISALKVSAPRTRRPTTKVSEFRRKAMAWLLLNRFAL